MSALELGDTRRAVGLAARLINSKDEPAAEYVLGRALYRERMLSAVQGGPAEIGADEAHVGLPLLVGAADRLDSGRQAGGPARVRTPGERPRVWRAGWRRFWKRSRSGDDSGPTRRSFLWHRGGSRGFRARAAASAGEPIIDSHVHLFLPEFAYHPNASYRPPAHPLGDYLAFLKQSPIGHAVVVHPEPYQDDHRILDYVFRHEPSPRFFKATCLFDPIDPKTPERMEALSRQYPGPDRGHSHS